MLYRISPVREMGTVSMGAEETEEAEEGSQSVSELKRSDPSWNSMYCVCSWGNEVK